jgi:hypothetical protein
MDAEDSAPDRTRDSTRDSTADARWMTFTELAEVRGISKASAIKLIRRRGWRRQRDNQGHVRALVPLPWASGEEDGERDRAGDREPDNQRDSTPGSLPYTGAIEVMLQALREAKDSEIAILREHLARSVALIDGFRERADRAEARAEEANKRADEVRRAAEARAEKAETALGAERQRADALRDRLGEAQTCADEAHALARAAEEAAAELRQDEAARKARGLVARLRAALRRE